MYALLASADTNQTIFLVIAIILFAVVAIWCFVPTPARDYRTGLLALGLACFALAFIVVSATAKTP
jgi:lipopolysaccharide export LptBFGC system permease protein LptF